MERKNTYGAFPPFRMFGNLYFVGTEPASSHLIDTGDGLILLDAGYSHSLYLVIDSIHRMGFDPREIRYLFLTHGHIDHMEAARAIGELSGCQIATGKEDRTYVNGEEDLSYAKELNMVFTEYFEPDILLSDGDSITLGNTTVTCMATPGHTPGAMSYFFPVTDGTRTFRAALHGGMGINTMCREFLDKYGLSYDCREQFQAAMDRLAEEPADIFLGNHMQHNETARKYQRILAGETDACIAPGEWSAYCRWAKENLLNMIREENAR